jgi:hypothetical protein
MFTTCKVRPDRGNAIPIRARLAFTLAEMTISMFVVALIGLTMASAITLAMRSAASTRDPASPYVQVVASRAALDMVSDDMKAATKIEPLYAPPWPSGTVGMTLTVPARNGDLSSETIVYSWAGAGQSLMRQYNSNAAVSIADNVQNFNVSYSPEMLLMDRDDGVSAPTSSVKAFALTNTTWVGQYFKPTLPTGATAWSITHAKVQLQRNGTATGNVSVAIYAANASQLPTGSALASGSVDISTVSSSAATWVNVPLSMTNLTPGAGYCLVIGTASGSVGGALYDANALTNTQFCSSTSGATAWAANSGHSLEFYLYGTTTP